MKVTFTGVEELQKGLLDRAQMDAVRKVVRFDGAQLQQTMQKNAVFTKGYSQGDTQKSIELQILDNGMTADVGPTTEYSPYLEYGTRFMEAQPFVRPSFYAIKEQFLRHLRQLFGG